MLSNWFDRVFKWAQPGMSVEVPESLGSSESLSSAAAIVHSDELTAELFRARRYEHDLAIVVLSAHPGLRGSEQQNGVTQSESNKLPQMIALLTAVALREVLRGSDVVCYQAAQNRFVLALPETEAEGASVAVDRVESHFRTRLRLRTRAGISCFPADAFTLEELVSSATLRTRVPEAHTTTNGNGREELPRRRVTARVRTARAGGK
ncbi:MAG TPA: hypothetical protein VMM35_11675 [Longimicrobiales bacterium]|nr:hypothetical protein [Longimicrobiales bacterium]